VFDNEHFLHDFDVFLLSFAGLISDAYSYIILSTFDACLWLNQVTFTGRLIYFDDENRNCTLNSSLPLTSQSLLPLNHINKRSTYYQSTLSFRFDTDQWHSANLSSKTTTATSSHKHDDHTWNSCSNLHQKNSEYISLQEINAILSHESHQFYSRPLYDALNLLIRYATHNAIDCKTLRLKSTMKKMFQPCELADVNIFSMRRISFKQLKNPIERIGQFSTMKNEYRSCQKNEKPPLAAASPSIVQSRIYYITSIFDEPFLMLRKRTDLQMKYNSLQGNLAELRGRVFHFHQLEGYCVDLAKEICSVLNITCVIRIVHDGNFGSENASTGSWDGK
jgi:hypothetical protein